MEGTLQGTRVAASLEPLSWAGAAAGHRADLGSPVPPLQLDSREQAQGRGHCPAPQARAVPYPCSTAQTPDAPVVPPQPRDARGGSYRQELSLFTDTGRLCHWQPPAAHDTHGDGGGHVHATVTTQSVGAERGGCGAGGRGACRPMYSRTGAGSTRVGTGWAAPGGTRGAHARSRGQRGGLRARYTTRHGDMDAAGSLGQDRRKNL